MSFLQRTGLDQRLTALAKTLSNDAPARYPGPLPRSRSRPRGHSAGKRPPRPRATSIRCTQTAPMAPYPAQGPGGLECSTKAGRELGKGRRAGPGHGGG